MKITKNCLYVVELNEAEYAELLHTLGESSGSYDLYDALDNAR